jgi:penicillin-binding protein 1A
MESTKFTKNLWRSIMSRIHEDLPYKDFEQPDGIKRVSVCSKSGKLAVDGLCNRASGGSAVYTEYFADGTQPSSVCDKHVSVTICKDSGKIAGENCPDTSKETRIIVVGSSDLNETCDIHNGEAEPEDPETEPDEEGEDGEPSVDEPQTEDPSAEEPGDVTEPVPSEDDGTAAEEQ